MYGKIQTRSYTDGSWRERKRKSPVPPGWKDESSQHKVLLGMGGRERVFPEDRRKFFTKTTTLSLPKKLSWKHTNSYKFLAYPGMPSGVGFREILHIIFV